MLNMSLTQVDYHSTTPNRQPLQEFRPDLRSGMATDEYGHPYRIPEGRTDHIVQRTAPQPEESGDS